MHIEQESPRITYNSEMCILRDNRRKKDSINKSIWWHKPVEELVVHMVQTTFKFSSVVQM